MSNSEIPIEVFANYNDGVIQIGYLAINDSDKLYISGTKYNWTIITENNGDIILGVMTNDGLKYIWQNTNTSKNYIPSFIYYTRFYKIPILSGVSFMSGFFMLSSEKTVDHIISRNAQNELVDQSALQVTEPAKTNVWFNFT